MAEFDEEVQSWTRASEGGYVDDPNDPGGATNMGITHKTLAAWLGVRSVTKQQVRSLTWETAAQIYKVNYWDKVWGDRLPYGLAYAVFDYAVNSGPARAVKDLQRTLNEEFSAGLGVDGVMGVQTLAAIERARIVDLIVAYCERRLAFVKSLSTFRHFGRGWTRRIMGETTGAQAGDVGVIDRAVMRYQNATNIPAPTAPAPGKAQPERPSPVDAIVKSEGGLSGLAAIVSGALAAIADQPILQIAAVVFVGFLLWRFVVSKRSADPA